MARTEIRTDRSHIGPEYSETTWLPHMDQLGGMEVRDVNGDKVGKVDDSYTDESGGYIRYIAVKTGWFGTKRHMVPIDDIQMMDDGDDQYLLLPYDKDHLREGPTHDRDEDFTREHETAVYGHYGRDAYWQALRARQTAPAPTPEIARAEMDAAIRRGDDPGVVATKRWGV